MSKKDAMQLLERGEVHLSAVAITTARRSQAFTVECVDRAARTFPKGDPTLLGRLWGWQLRASSALGKEPNVLIDDAYAFCEQLLALHRQFAQRMFEAIDTRPDDVSDRDAAPSDGVASVTSLAPRRRGTPSSRSRATTS